MQIQSIDFDEGEQRRKRDITQRKMEKLYVRNSESIICGACKF